MNTKYDSVLMLPDASLKKSIELRLESIDNDKSLEEDEKLQRKQEYLD